MLKTDLRYFLLTVAVLAALTGCSQSRTINNLHGEENGISVAEQYIRPLGRPSFQSLDLYLRGEIAFSEERYQLAAALFRQADFFDPLNISIKERLLEVSLLMAESNHTLYEDIIELGESYISSGFISEEIYRITGQAYLAVGMSKEGLTLMRLALEIDPDPYFYYEYFILAARHKEVFEFDYLDKAIEQSWDNPAMINAISQLFEYHDLMKSKAILEKAYHIYGEDEDTLTNLLDFYRDYHDWKSFNQVLEERIREGKHIPAEYSKLYLRRLFYLEDYEQISNVYDYFKNSFDSTIIRFLFYSSFQTQEYQRVLHTGSIITLREDLSHDEADLINIYTGKAHYYLGNIDDAFKYLSRIQNHILLLGVIQILQDYEPDQTIEYYTENLTAAGMDEAYKYFILFIYHLSSEEQQDEEIRLSLDSLVRSDKEDDAFWMRVSLLLMEEEFYEEASVSLTKIRDIEFDANHFLGEYYHSLEKDSLAVEYLTQSLITYKEPPPELYLTLASAYNRTKQHGKEIALMEEAVKIYPDDAYILNWLGYTLVVHTERYSEAEDYLLKAIDISPDSEHIQDSVAWLYYKLQDYNKALYYMQDIIKKGVNNSIISYHIGMIFLKLEDLAQAEDYLLMAIEIDDDNEAVSKAKDVLLSIGVKNE